MLLMSYRQAFEILEIEMTKEVRAIKKAYAGMVKRYHPEEYPEKWQQIHAAYERAMEYSKFGQGDVVTRDDGATQEDVIEPLSAQETGELPVAPPISEQEESEVDFSKLGVIAQQNRFEQKKEHEETLQKALELLNEQDKQRNQSAKDWKKLLDTPQVRMVRTDATFLYRMGDVLGKKKISYSCYRIIRQFLQGASGELEKGLYDDKTENGSLNAWEVANSGLKKAAAINANVLGVFIAAVIFVIVGVMWLTNRPEPYGNQSVTSLERDGETEYALIYTYRHEDTDILKMTYYASQYPQETTMWDWTINNMDAPQDVMEMAGLESEEQVVTSFVVSYRYGIKAEADVAVCLSEFGLDANNIQVWQYDKTGYREMDIQDASNWVYGQEVVYPFVLDDYLYINTEVCETRNYDRGYPVVLIQKSR